MVASASTCTPSCCCSWHGPRRAAGGGGGGLPARGPGVGAALGSALAGPFCCSDGPAPCGWGWGVGALRYVLLYLAPRKSCLPCSSPHALDSVPPTNLGSPVALKKNIKSILVSQPAPTDEKSPYHDLAEKHKLKDRFPPLHQGGRWTGVPPGAHQHPDHSAAILTSRNAVDHFFRMCKEMRITVPEDLKYFCVSESVAYYVQKYIVYRKRKVFIGKHTFADLMDVIKKHKARPSSCRARHPEAGIPLLDKANIGTIPTPCSTARWPAICRTSRT